MLSPRDAWQATLGQLQLQLNRATFETWLKGSEVLAYEDGEFVIRVRHAYAKDWLEKHLQHTIIQTLGDILGRSVKVNYVVYLPNRQRTQPDLGPLWDQQPAQNEHDSLAEETPEPLDNSEWDPRLTSFKRSKADDSDPFRTPLNRRYTFEAFVTGPSNQFAAAAAKAVAQAPGEMYNPLFIHSGSGLGKTHLLQAIGHRCEDDGLDVIYITAEAFTNELVMAIRARKTEEFRERYRQVDVLLVDDIQFMAGKTSSEEEFYYTFNTICSHGGQVVVASNSAPKAMTSLDERLRSRFQGGLIADIQPPELETRLRILAAKAAAQHAELPDDVAELLARHVTSDIRILEGILTQVLARAALSKQPLTLALAQHVLDKNGALPRRSTNLDEVLEATATYHQLSLDDLVSKRRTKEVVRARHIAIYLAREETDASLPQIGEALGGRNHSTVLHGYQKIADEVASDKELRDEVSAIRRQLYLFPNN
jgi:chromosomal replication initiator protein